MANPTNNIKLLENVDIKRDYKNTFTFLNLSEQTAFFKSKAVRDIQNVSFVRQDKVFRYGGNIEDIKNISYIMFQNSDKDNKWYYAFVVDIIYIGETVTHITYEIDVMQTWKFDIKYTNCMVEREHVSNDSIGVHTVEEGLNIGEMVIASQKDTTIIEDLTYVFVATEFIGFPPDIVPSGSVYSGVYTGLWFFATDDLATLDTWILHYSQGTQDGNLISIFTMPKNLVSTQASGVVLPSSGGQFEEDGVTAYYGTHDGYTPKNNKLYSFPYNYLEVNNNQGNSNIYRYEFFATAFCNFIMTGNVVPNPTIYIAPQSYKNVAINDTEYLTLTDYPLCSWKGDVYATWLAQNQVSNVLRVGGAIGATAFGIATGNPLAIAGGLTGLASSIGSFKEASIKPDIAKGSSSGGGNVARSKQTFSFLQKTMRAENARIIDDYFTMYGYKVNELKTPNFESRPNWNYLKLLEANIFGNFNNSDLEKIRTILENGITFWHNDNVGNYNRGN